jgi:PiT family inorganic phosphate transporter
MGKGVVDTSLVTEYLILAALIGAVVWVWVCTHYGLPISVSHSLIGGLIGPVWFTYGTSGLVAKGIIKIAAFIVLSPLIGMILGFLIMCLVMLVFKRTSPYKAENLFKGMQLFSSAIFSLGHGGNDAQKTMGIIALLLFSGAGSNDFIAQNLFDPEKGFHIPYWLVITCYSVISLGTLAGGWRVIKTLGDGLSKLKPVHGFCAETAGAITLIGTALGGIPVSTTHTITGSIIGVSITKGLASVRWATASNIVVAWICTIPATLVLSGLIYLIMGLFITLPVV